MRLWNIHPMYLDTAGLNALWREGLGALAVIDDPTSAGYYKHPQLEPFIRSGGGRRDIAQQWLVEYMWHVHRESVRRGFKYDLSLVMRHRDDIPCVDPDGIIIPKGQLLFEFTHLQTKLRTRDPVVFKRNAAHHGLGGRPPVAHPSVVIDMTDATYADWEKV